MSQIEPVETRDLEAERVELLALIGASVPPALQQSIDLAVSLTQKEWDWQLVPTENGSGNAKPE